MKPFDFITILGPTACGKTNCAVKLADAISGEIISADSRQVYRRMDIGTGKDLADYTINGHNIPYHLIDIAEPGEKYNIFRFQQDFLSAFELIKRKGKEVIVCGGSGLYLESILRNYRLQAVPVNPDLRAQLANKSLAELTLLLSSYKRLHNTTDTDTAQRAIRAIEIEEYYRQNPRDERPFPSFNSFVVGLDVDRETRRERITKRLHERLNNGMVEEVRRLIDSGVPTDTLISYGLEYKYLSLYILGVLTYDDMVRLLEIAIHQFAKRQMTWFRGMERRGIEIHWVKPGEEFEHIMSSVYPNLSSTN
ncbi:MAG: tRNA (adenosine(37)-N6)-dimethylallyltransferase MiaA [Alloprevotella sp.]|nr:tRNA (adenosine(37)-N6)-dimethylallyltransferase MiaA [Alloprevotella sp.]